MEKKCCDINVTETEKGYKIEVTGDEVKTKCKEKIEKWCKDGNCGEMFKKECCQIVRVMVQGSRVKGLG